MSNEIATRSPVQELVASIRTDEFKEQVGLALPEGMRPERFVRVMATALLDNPELADADPNSVFQAGLRCATDGLLPDGREAAFVMFGKKAAYLPMIAGFRRIAADYGWSLRTQVVHDADEFEYSPADGTIVHRPARPGVDRGEPIGAYCVAQHKDGRREVEFMSVAEIEKVRQTSRAKNSGPWVEWWERMAEKTVGRRSFKKLPLDDADRRVASLLAADDDPEAATTRIYGREDAAAETRAVIEHKSEPSKTGAGEGSGGEAAAEDPVTGGDSAAPVEDEALAAEMEGSSFEPPTDAKTNPDVQAADIAGGFKIPRGTNEGTTLRELYEQGDKGIQRIAYVLRNWTDEKDADLHAAALAFVKVYAPEVFMQVTTETAA